MKKIIVFLACLWALPALTQQDLEICSEGYSVTYSVGMDIPGTVEWFLDGELAGGGLSTTITYTHPGNYQLVAIGYNVLGCPGTPMVYNISVTQCDPLLYWIPNTFTPDDNEHNQMWTPVFTNGFDPNEFFLIVFNRWGEVVWESRNPYTGWDGTYNNTKCQDGTYTYKVWFGDAKTDAKYNVYGHFTLII